MTIDNTIQQLSGKFLVSLTSALLKENPKHEIFAEPALHIMLHMISCTQALRDKFNNADKSKYSLSAQLFQPFLNGLLALFGKVLMDSFTSEPKLSDINNFTQGFGIVSKHILHLFPEMAIKKHKTSGKMLIHHAVFKARPAIAEETVRQILAIHPDCASSKDSSGATPLHWATRNDEIAVEVLDILLKNAPESPAASDNKGFLPLHWAVNQDTPHIEVVRKLLKVYPQAASTTSFNGYLPIHYCVLRDRPSAAALKALMAVHPEGIRSKCMEGNLPLHIYLHRETVDMDIVRLLINFYPEGLFMVNNRNQLPLHIALDVPMPNLPAIQLILKEYPQGAQQQDSDGYLPLHLSIDNAYPNYTLANHILNAFPQGAQYTTKDGMLPLHLIVSTNHNPPAPFISSVIASYPEGIYVPVTDVVPAVDMSMSEPDSWSGDWCEKQWTPLSKAKDRNMDNSILNIFYKYGNLMKNDPGKYTHGVVAYVRVPGEDDSAGSVKSATQPATTMPVILRATQPIRTIQSEALSQGIELQHNRPINSNQSPHTPRDMFVPDEDMSSNTVRSAATAPSQDTRSSLSQQQQQQPEDDGQQNFSSSTNDLNLAQNMRQPEVMMDNFTASNGGVVLPAKPMSKLPPNILKAQMRASQALNGGNGRDPSPQGVKLPFIGNNNTNNNNGNGNGSRDPSPFRVTNRDRDPSPMEQQQARTTTPPGNMRAPPAGPIPQSLLLAAENNAMRHGGGGTRDNNRKYLTKMGNSNTHRPSSGDRSNTASSADEPRQDGNNSNDNADAKQKRLLQAQQIYVKRGVNVLNNNSMSATQPLQGSNNNTNSTYTNNNALSSTMPHSGPTNKVYLKPTNATSSNTTSEILRSLPSGGSGLRTTGGQRVHPVVGTSSSQGNYSSADESV